MSLCWGGEPVDLPLRSGALIVVVEASLSALGADGPQLALRDLLGGGHGCPACGSRLISGVAARAALLASSAPPLLEVEVPEAGLKVKVKCFRVPDASARVEPELNPDFPPLSKH